MLERGLGAARKPAGINHSTDVNVNYLSIYLNPCASSIKTGFSQAISQFAFTVRHAKKLRT